MNIHYGHAGNYDKAVDKNTPTKNRAIKSNFRVVVFTCITCRNMNNNQDPLLENAPSLLAPLYAGPPFHTCWGRLYITLLVCHYSQGIIIIESDM